METLLFEVAWTGLLAWLRVPEENAREVRGDILARYREPARAYHNLRHALRVLRDVNRFVHAWGVEDYGAVQLAALLHDIIYDTRSRENEARSAEFVLQWGRRLDIAPDTCRRAIRREYRWVMEADWIVGRGRVLSGFLEREWIYHLPALRDNLEEAARDNIARELSLL